MNPELERRLRQFGATVDAAADGRGRAAQHRRPANTPSSPISTTSSPSTDGVTASTASSPWLPQRWRSSPAASSSPSARSGPSTKPPSGPLTSQSAATPTDAARRRPRQRSIASPTRPRRARPTTTLGTCVGDSRLPARANQPPVCSSYTVHNDYHLEICDDGAAVRLVQERLRATVDSWPRRRRVLRPGTRTAVRAFQQSHGLTVDGQVGPATWKLLVPGRSGHRHRRQRHRRPERDQHRLTPDLPHSRRDLRRSGGVGGDRHDGGDPRHPAHRVVGHAAGRHAAGGDPVRVRPHDRDRRRRGDHRTVGAAGRGARRGVRNRGDRPGPSFVRRPSEPDPTAGADRCGSSTAICCTSTAARPRLARVVAGLDADVLAFTEYTPATPAGCRASPLASSFPYRIENPEPSAGGSALWSRYPLTAIAAPPALYQSTAAVVEALGGIRARTSSIHRIRSPNLPRVARRTRRLGRPVRESSDRPTIVVGDFNATSWHPPFRRVARAGWRDAHQLVGPWPLRLVADRQVVDAADAAPRPRAGRRHASLSRCCRRRPSRQRPPWVRRHALDQSGGAGRASSAFSITSGSDGWIQYCFVATSRAVRPNDIAWISGWITVAASGPMTWAPRSRPVRRIGEHLDEAGRVLPRPPGGDPGIVVAGRHVVDCRGSWPATP